MIPVTQTKVVVKDSKGNQVVYGNCYAAAIASLLELPITEVPNVETLFKVNDLLWIQVMDAFLAAQGYELMTNDWFKVFHDGRYGVDDGRRFQMMQYCENKFYLVSGPSIRWVKHICIYKNGSLVHDPHPTKEGLTALEDFQELIKIN
jgi:hypothetical protein